ncbi:MAG: ester cyclase [bacterium]|nr:ester cyclase [bacterium]
MRWTAVGTHRGAYLGAEPTGKRITFKGIEVIRVRDGRITARWGEWDGLDLLGQLERDL